MLRLAEKNHPFLHNTFVTLQKCSEDNHVFDYVVQSLQITLRDIDLSKAFCDRISDFLVHLRRKIPNRDIFNAAFLSITDKWKFELRSKYSEQYELCRQNYFKRFIFDMFKAKGKIKLLDMGCGKGLVSQLFMEQGLASDIWGIDIDLEFESFWKEISRNIEHLNFTHINGNLTFWLDKHHFQYVILFWVLHHSTPEQVLSSLKALSDTQNEGLRLVLIEDSFPLSGQIESDPNSFFSEWKGLANLGRNVGRNLTWEVQALLDFIAVKILARYHEVGMAFNYMDVESWVELLKKFNFILEGSKFIGFPPGRDIAVPQSALVFGLDKATCLDRKNKLADQDF